MRRTQAVAMTALTTLFFAEGQRALFASLFGLGYEALFPRVRPGVALLSLIPLLALLAPLLPIPRWLHRAGAVATAAAGVAVFRVPMTHPALETRLVGGAMVVACGAMFITWAVGFVDRRGMAAGVVLGLVADQLFRLAGATYDISLQPGWLPVQAVLSLALLAAVVAWSRAEGRRPDAATGAAGLERRAGGLRLRGAMAMGALLFMDLHVLGLPAVAARWSGISHAVAAGAIGVAGAVAVAAALFLARPTRGRTTTLLLVGLVAGGAVLGYATDGWPGLVAMAGGHCGALLLLTRAMDPASGRRSGAMGVVGFSIFTLATALYALTFYAAFTLPALEGGAPWIFGAVGLLLAGCFILLPRPAELTPPGSWLPAAGAALAVLGATVALAAVAARPGARGAGPASPAGPVSDTIRVATWNVHYGFDEEWRFDPGAMARTLAGAGASVVALQEVLVGSPTAYGVDLPLWLGRRLGARDHFHATINGLLGDAFLTTRRDARVDREPLPAVGGERKQRLRLRTRVGGSDLSLHAVHLAVESGARPDQIAATLGAIGPGPTVLLGDLNAEAGSGVLRRIRQAGFRDVFTDAANPPSTFPARRPERRIDWILIRDLGVVTAAVLEAAPSDHRPVVATLHIP